MKLLTKRNISNLLECTDFLCPLKCIPLDIRVIILTFSGLVRVGSRSIAYVIY